MSGLEPPMPPAGADDDSAPAASDQATAPFDPAPDVEDEQQSGMAPLDPDKGAP